MVEVKANGEAQGASVAYMQEDRDRFVGVRGVGGAYHGDRYQGRQEQRGSYHYQQRGGYLGGTRVVRKGERGTRVGKEKARWFARGRFQEAKSSRGVLATGAWHA